MEDYDIELPQIRARLEALFDPIVDGTLDELAGRLDVVIDIVARAKGLLAALELALAERMEADSVQVEDLGWLVRKPRWSSAGSDWAGAREAGRTQIMRTVCLDQGTGEMRQDWRMVARETLDLVDASFSIGAPKKAGFRRLGLDESDFVTSVIAGYQVVLEK